MITAIAKVFGNDPLLTDDKLVKLEALGALILDWNERVNLVSRKDVENLGVRHMLHSLLMAKAWQPDAGAAVADVGSGGGFPGLPLAILFPDTRFTLIDSVAKKVAATTAIVEDLHLHNVHVISDRAENIRDHFDYVTGRAVAALPTFISWTRHLIQPGQSGNLPNGLLYFKGTMWRDELGGNACQPSSIWNLSDYCNDEYFAEKFLLHFNHEALQKIELPAATS